MNSNFADASPTKELFVDFLTKDLTLNRAITDLVDNTVDGAHRVKSNGDLSEFFVRLKVSPESFEIADNCGGIQIGVAREYAFRFGRPPEVPPTPHSVGQFGVGMKRALFKLGKHFTVTSISNKSRFVLEVDVESWKHTHDWLFDFTLVDENDQDPATVGTIITVTHLLPAVSDAFKLDNFRTRLGNELRAAHQQSIGQGLSLSINGVALSATRMYFRQSPDIQTAYKELRFGDGPNLITVRLYAGIADSKPTEAGWYIFCNGRMLLQADQTSVTGWGEEAGERIPKYHNQYATFRGVVYFDSVDTSRLPWNTTKTGVDAESPIYKQVREEMIVLMRPVIDFLNEWDRERTTASEDAPLGRAVNEASLIALSEQASAQLFKVRPRRNAPSGVRLQRVQYDRPLDKVLKAKESLNALNFKQVGELTFDYYYSLECEE